MKIAIDLDNVLNNLVETAADLYQKETGDYTKYDFSKYYFYDCLPAQVAFKFSQIVNHPLIYTHVKPVEGSQKAIEYLLEDYHNEVYIATAGQPVMFDCKVSWLLTYFPDIKTENIIAINYKDLLNVDILIEDNIQQLLNGHIYTRVLYDQPWNQDIHDDVYGIHRMHHWDEIVEFIKNIKRGIYNENRS